MIGHVDLRSLAKRVLQNAKVAPAQSQLPSHMLTGLLMRTAL